MSDQTLFYVVFLSQVLLISFFLPRRVLRLLSHVVGTYPPSEYPKLYPKSIDYYEKTQRNYRNMNRFVLLAGLVLVFLGVNSPGEEMLGWDSASVLVLYCALQFLPTMMVAASSGFIYFSPKRRLDARTTRRADLRPRRLFDVVSPTFVGLAIFVYLAFVGLVLYVRQFEFPWFGGYWNIVGVTALNLLFAGLLFRLLYGKKKDPYQAREDRMKEIGLTARILILGSIVGTLFIAMNVILHALDQKNLLDVSQSLYFQLLAIISFREFRIDNVDFEVYKEDPLVAEISV